MGRNKKHQNESGTGSDSGSASISGTMREALFCLIMGRSQPGGLDIPPSTNIL